MARLEHKNRSARTELPERDSKPDGDEKQAASPDASPCMSCSLLSCCGAMGQDPAAPDKDSKTSRPSGNRRPMCFLGLTTPSR